MRRIKGQCLTRPSDFRQIKCLGRKFYGLGFILYYYLRPEEADMRPEEADISSFRYAVIASKRVGNAVKRNRAKRLLREIIKSSQAEIPENCDILLIAKSAIHQIEYKHLVKDFLNFVSRIREATH